MFKSTFSCLPWKWRERRKMSTALPRMWPRHTTITQTIWWNICFPFYSWSCISCECCGWWEVRSVSVCVMANENIVAPYIGAKPQILSCTVHMDAEVILFYTTMCGCVGRRAKVHCEFMGNIWGRHHWAFQTEVHVKFIQYNLFRI